MLDTRVVIAGLALAALAAGCAGARTNEAAPATAIDNQRVLTHKESLRLISWAKTFRRCVVESGTELGKVVPSRTQISMELPLNGGSRDPDVAQAAVTCGDKQGGPPSDTSLQYRDGEFVLYLPKQCLLDPKVAAPPAG